MKIISNQQNKESLTILQLLAILLNVTESLTIQQLLVVLLNAR